TENDGHSTFSNRDMAKSSMTNSQAGHSGHPIRDGPIGPHFGSQIITVVDHFAESGHWADDAPIELRYSHPGGGIVGTEAGVRCFPIGPRHPRRRTLNYWYIQVDQ